MITDQDFKKGLEILEEMGREDSLFEQEDT